MSLTLSQVRANRPNLILLDAEYSISDCLKLYSLQMLRRTELGRVTLSVIFAVRVSNPEMFVTVVCGA
jgi:hypothetical protein